MTEARQRRRRAFPTWARLGSLLLLAAFLLPSPADAKGRERGERVLFTGLVTDASGRPLGDVQVILESARRKFLARKLRRETLDTFRVSTETDPSGAYSITWPWNDYYNHYELLVAVPYRRGNQETLQILARYEITDKAEEGTPVVTSLVVADTTFLNTLRRFLADMDTPDERRTYQRMGKPDKVEQVGPHGEVEAAWWYFEAGRVFRFKAGKLEDEDTFDPVKKFR
ncbi:MAG: carboxypeptidase regulatory-like domain-containing protein [Acidobacteria bacterium]|nr:carboxypeptidase regulatory-like domain-containing protein [Acidobacteriota bacterium]